MGLLCLWWVAVESVVDGTNIPATAATYYICILLLPILIPLGCAMKVRNIKY